MKGLRMGVRVRAAALARAEKGCGSVSRGAGPRAGGRAARWRSRERAPSSVESSASCRSWAGTSES